ncbi:sugar phosphate isomerase/epimerase family protein [Allomuricauda sp. XS_ASV26]|jgi:sugar phosphate isomerase/epimerase|uniref:sugar phosphate isomerase/epimerase family protein n=1 Tax=Flavobacteriaceae TaxID=49546 RepID=UPI001CD59511|nr:MULTISPECIES: sugar phosphate isomerase/epimerase family protein [Allomuricauda]MCA0958498.1 sugar phosphate isomerase/epimerase [Allomuricauda ruestringensis]USD26793.1 sugar phosphate isomerase/epimerase [Allomuricauda aquimarina]
MNRRRLTQKSIVTLIFVVFLGFSSCKENQKKESEAEKVTEQEVAEESKPEIKLSLAQWSMHKMILEEGVDPYSFAEKASNWGFEGLEYVSGLYYKELQAANFSEEAMNNWVEKSKAESEKYGLRNLLIMVDGQGDIAVEDETKRTEAVENHYKWVDAAAALGCHSIRVNLNGSMEPEVWIPASVEGLKQLAGYAKEKNINIIVENHGGPSSNGALLAEVMEKVGMENCGTLPDFGNFCIKREAGDYYSSKCLEEYDRYKGTKELMPYAKGVSAKSYSFDEEGNETRVDYPRIMEIVLESGYEGFVGVEYEGSDLSEEEGILATKRLLERIVQ